MDSGEKREFERLAEAGKCGRATEPELNRLAAMCLDYARVVISMHMRCGAVRAADRDDVAQEAVIRAFRYLPRWDAHKARWVTYFARIVLSAIGRQQRRYLKDTRIMEAVLNRQSMT